MCDTLLSSASSIAARTQWHSRYRVHDPVPYLMYMSISVCSRSDLVYGTVTCDVACSMFEHITRQTANRYSSGNSTCQIPCMVACTTHLYCSFHYYHQPHYG